MQVQQEILVRCPDCGRVHIPVFIGQQVQVLLLEWVAGNSGNN